MMSEGKHDEAESKFDDALSIFTKIGAAYEATSIYDDLATLALKREDYSRAEEMALLLEKEGRRLGYTDLNIRSLMTLADCEIRSGRADDAIDDYSEALEIAKGRGISAYSKTVFQLIVRVLDYIESPSRQKKSEGSKPAIESLRSKLAKRDYKGLLENLPLALQGEFSSIQN